MKKILSLLMMMVAAATVCAQTMYICQGSKCTAVAASDAGTMSYGSGSTITIAGVTYNVSDIDSITFKKPAYAQSDTVYVKYDGTSASVTANNDSVSYTVSGADVTINATTTTTEFTYIVSGTSTDGSLTINGVYKLTLVLNGVTLTNADGAAIDVECGKRINVVLADGTTNTLVDGSGGTQKACFYVKGHTEFKDGTGTLCLTGNTKHAFSSKEYLEMKKTAGTIIVKGAVGDGIHCGEYFDMNGGAITVSNVQDDGIDNDDSGYMNIDGGTLDITASAASTNCIKSDSLFTMTGGIITLTVPGKGCHGLSFDGNAIFKGGTINATVAGDTAKVIKCDGNLTIVGGTYTYSCSGAGSKCIKADGTLTIGENVGTALTAMSTSPYLKCTTTGAALATSGSSSSAAGFGGGGPGGGGPGGGGGGGTTEDSTKPKAITAEGAVAIYNGHIECSTSKDGGEGIESKTSLTVDNGELILATYDDALQCAGKININGGYVQCVSSGNDAIDSNTASGITIAGGVVLGLSFAGSPEEGIDIDSGNLNITGGYLFSMGGAQGGSTPAVPTSSTAIQPTALLSNVAVNNTYYTLSIGGTKLFTVKLPGSLSQNYSLISAPGMTKGSSCILYKGTEAPTSSSSSYNSTFWISPTVTTSSSVKSWTQSSNYTTVN